MPKKSTGEPMAPKSKQIKKEPKRGGRGKAPDGGADDEELELVSSKNDMILLGTWNMQGQGASSGKAKGADVLHLFKTYPCLDIMMLQEAGTHKAGGLMALTDRGDSKARRGVNKEVTLKRDFVRVGCTNHPSLKTLDLHHGVIVLHRGGRGGIEEKLGVIWYSSTEGQDDLNPRCSMAIIYRMNTMFGKVPTYAEVAARLEVSFYLPPEKPGKPGKMKNESKPPKRLRPVIAFKSAEGLSICNIHAPSTSNKFPARVAFTQLSDKAARGLCVIAGDFNFTPEKLIKMKDKAAEMRIAGFNYDCARTATQNSGGTLDFAMGNVPITHLSLGVLHAGKGSEGKTKRELREIMKGLGEEAKSAGELDAIDRLMAAAEDLEVMQGYVEGEPDDQDAKEDVVILTEMVQDLEKAVKEFKEARLKLLTENDPRHLEKIRSDHAPQFFLVGIEPPEPLFSICVQRMEIET